MKQSVTKSESANGRTKTATPATTVPISDVSDAMRELRSRTPQESLGVNAQKSLWTAFLQATVVIAILFCGWTALAYFSDRNSPPAEKTDKKAASGTADNPAPAQPNPDGVAKNGDGTANPKPPGKKDIVDVLGENKTKQVSPKSNPLDRKDDDLFKDSK